MNHFHSGSGWFWGRLTNRVATFAHVFKEKTISSKKISFFYSVKCFPVVCAIIEKIKSSTMAPAIGNKNVRPVLGYGLLFLQKINS
jgi:hypothetical protein